MSTRNIITSLENARALRAMGAPLNTEVVDGGQLPERCEKLIKTILNAASRCRSAAYAFLRELQEHAAR